MVGHSSRLVGVAGLVGELRGAGVQILVVREILDVPVVHLLEALRCGGAAGGAGGGQKLLRDAIEGPEPEIDVRVRLPGVEENADLARVLPERCETNS